MVPRKTVLEFHHFRTVHLPQINRHQGSYNHSVEDAIGFGKIKTDEREAEKRNEGIKYHDSQESLKVFVERRHFIIYTY